MYLKCLNRHTERGIALALRQIGWLVSKQIRNLLNFISKVSIQPYINILKNKVFIKESAEGATKILTIFFQRNYTWYFIITGFVKSYFFHDIFIKFHDISMTFPEKQNSMTFPWHSITKIFFQVFHDMYEPCIIEPMRLMQNQGYLCREIWQEFLGLPDEAQCFLLIILSGGLQ